MDWAAIERTRALRPTGLNLRPAMLHITEEHVREHLPMPKAIELMEQAFSQLANGSAVNHPRPAPHPQGRLHAALHAGRQRELFRHQGVFRKP